MNFENNPFWQRDAITKRENFFGRRKETDILFDLLRNAQSCSVIGERKIGKTSLLKHIVDRQVQIEYNLLPPDYVFIYFDFQGKGSITRTMFWRVILKMLVHEFDDGELRSSCEQLSQKEQIDFLDVEELLISTQQKGIKLIFVFDEFEYATMNKNLDFDFFGGLRSFANNYDLAYITASRSNLLDLHYNESLLDSPFFNIFTSIHLGPFLYDEVHVLINELLRDTSVTFDEEDESFAIRMAGYYPFFLQIVCYHLFAQYSSGRQKSERKEIFDLVTATFNREAELHFQYFWNKSNNIQKLALSTLSILEMQEKEHFKTGGFSTTLIREINNLRGRGLVKQESGKSRLFSAAFSKWILDELIQKSEAVKVKDFEVWLEEAEIKDIGEQAKETFQRGKSLFMKVKPEYWVLLARLIAEAGNMDFITKLWQ